MAKSHAPTLLLAEPAAAAKFDTRLWLFNVDGTAVLGNDNGPGDASFRSLLTDPASYPGPVAATAAGVSRAAFEIARDYAKEREAFGAPIATKQAIAFKIADMAIEIDAARLLVWEAAWLLDGGAKATREAVLASRQAAQVALVVSDGAVQVLGGYGYIRDYLPEMLHRNARGFATFEALTLI